ncbi:ATP synthase F1 subunit epsilon [bacterium]|nr:ATP synthase F1 subunit epsilon [bacterium]
MHLEIVTPDVNLYKGEITSAIFPGSDGSFGIMNGHASIVSTLKAGVIKVTEADDSEKTFEVKGGVVELNNNKIIVLAD